MSIQLGLSLAIVRAETLDQVLIRSEHPSSPLVMRVFLIILQTFLKFLQTLNVASILGLFWILLFQDLLLGSLM